MKRLRIVILIMMAALSVAPAYGAAKIAFVGNGDNGLCRLLASNGVRAECFGSVEEAIAAVPAGGGMFVTAANYPAERAAITPAQYDRIARKGIRLYVEYPSSVPGRVLPADSYEAFLERGVVSSGFFGKELPPMSILGVNGCHIIKVSGVRNPVISFAKVAGFDKADYGLTGTEAWPLLFVEGDRMVCTSSLSVFDEARYGPADSWKIVLEGVIGWVLRDDGFRITSMPVDPAPAFAADAQLPPGARADAIKRGADWIWKANLLIHPSRLEQMELYQPKGGDPNLFFGPPVGQDELQGDGSCGVMEGHGSYIFADGTQKYRYLVRGDVQGETAFLLAAAAGMTGDARYARTAENLLDYLFYTSQMRESRPDRSSYGLIGWATATPWVYYGDDNARCLLGAIGASSAMDNQRWNRLIAEGILANLRTASRQGFQGEWLHRDNIEANGWRFYRDRDHVNTHPHFESWMWACFLWLYDKTGYEPLLEKARAGISIMMDAYPDKWATQNGMQQERGRMILPLAWLVRVDDTPRHREWLDTMISEVLAYQEPNGAIREVLGDKGQDKYGLLVHSNAEYGKFEAPLIARNGDPAADMLYTCNFAFFGLNEAYHATGEERYRDALAGLADFLVRIQARSDRHPDLDGAWFRAFDYGRWDYWGSNADNGWGVWCTLTGWIQSWIVATEAMVENDSSYWEMTRNMDMSAALAESLWMLE